MSDPPVRRAAQPSPSPSAEIRSQAIAKLKRAASLPRTPDGRRRVEPGNVGSNGPSAPSEEGGSSLEDATPSPRKVLNDYGDEELLSPSPGRPQYGGGTSMQRSVSDSSSFHVPTPPHLNYGNGSPFYSAQASPAASGSDWAAYQLAQSYLPSISPASAPPSAFPANLAAAPAGRNTPSPLPTLSDLRNLSRSNSAAARANAMNKLIGGGSASSKGGTTTPTRSTNVGTPLSSSEEDLTLTLPGSRPTLHRAGTIGIPRMFGLPTMDTQQSADDSALGETTIPDTQFDVTRPRLQRSFTVSSTNMGEERRSAVGRRMVERLAERRQARQQEEAEVRQLWEERRHTRLSKMSQKSQQQPVVDTSDETFYTPPLERSASDMGVASNGAADTPAAVPAVAAGAAVVGGALAAPAFTLGRDLLSQNRTPSRSTERSELFEFESHLGRSLSTRTRNEVDASPSVITSPLYESATDRDGIFRQQQLLKPEYGADDPTPLPIPNLPFASPTRHLTHESTSSQATISPERSQQGYLSADRSPRIGSSSDDIFSVGSHDTARDVYSNGGLLAPRPDAVRQSGEFPYLPSLTPDHDTARDYFMDHHATRTSDTHDAYDGSRTSGNYPTSGSSPVDTRTGSQASWNEVSAPSDYESDHRQHKKGSSISKMRDLFTRRPSRRGSGSVTSPPRSPHDQVSIGDVGEATSSASSQLRPSRPASPERRGYPQASSPAPTPGATNLIQHQLAQSSASHSFLPRANLNDPRIHNSKLSPFPGISALEQRSRSGDTLEAPSLAHTVSDSAVPRARSPHGAVMDIQRESADAGKQSSHGHKSDPSRVSVGSGSGYNGSGSAYSASAQGSGRGSHSEASNRGHSYGYSDDFRNGRHPGDSVRENGSSSRGTSPEVLRNTPSRQRGEIPAFLTNRRRAPPPPIDVTESNVVSINDDITPSTSSFTGLPQRSQGVLRRMDDVLALSANDPSRPDFLDDPPRKLLLAQQVIQVVSSNTAKDRYLFMFNDILVIAKPVITTGTMANLDMKFVVKSIVSLDKLVVSGITDEPAAEPQRHPMVQQFIHDFASDGVGAVHRLVERSNPRIDTATLGSLLFRTPELDKTQLGVLLAHDLSLKRTFMDRFNFAQMRIDDALRMVLLSVRLPTDISAAEALLRGFANGYYKANEGHVAYDNSLAGDLVLAILELNDMLYSTFGFAFPNHAISRSTFVSAFRSKDPQGMVPDDLLEAIFHSIRQSRLVQALSPQEAHHARDITVLPARLPTKLTYHEWSEKITISIPRPDPSFKIRLHSAGLEFDPPVLDFAQTNEASFRVRGVVLGPKTMLFERLGANSALYAGIGNSRNFTVERAYMRHTFHVAFMSHTGAKRKYCFSVPDAAARQRWGQMLSRQIWLTTEKRQGVNAPSTAQARVRRAAEAVSLQVLRDALLASDDKDKDKEHRDSSPQSTPARLARVGSVSVAYLTAMAGQEADLGPLQPTPGSDALSGMVELQTGKELVLLCRQNSLLPSVLELLQSGAEAQAAQQPLTPATAPALSRATHLQHAQQRQGSAAGLRAMMHDRRL